MKKFTLLPLLLAFFCSVPLAAEEAGDTLFHYRGRAIALSDSAEEVRIRLAHDELPVE